MIGDVLYAHRTYSDVTVTVYSHRGRNDCWWMTASQLIYHLAAELRSTTQPIMQSAEEHDTTVTVFVKILWTNKIYTLDFHPTDLVETLASAVEDITGAGIDHLRVSYYGKQVFCGRWTTEGECVHRPHTIESVSRAVSS